MKPVECNKNGVVCEWMQTGRILINPDGQVFPCCYLANVTYMVDKLGTPEQVLAKKNNLTDQIGQRNLIQKEFYDEPVMVEYVDNKEKYNVFHTPFEEIINSEWFTKTLPESWDDSDRLVLQCAQQCGTVKHRGRK